MAVLGGLKSGIKTDESTVVNHTDITADDMTSIGADQKWRAILSNCPKQSLDACVKKYRIRINQRQGIHVSK